MLNFIKELWLVYRSKDGRALLQAASIILVAALHNKVKEGEIRVTKKDGTVVIVDFKLTPREASHD